jgi:hypothetical protein
MLAGFRPFALQSCDYVPELSCYINLEQRGIRRREVSGVDECLSLQQLFENPKIMQEYSILICGPPATTGYGKSCIARSLASAYLKWRVDSGECMPNDTFVHITSTMDYLQGKRITKDHAIIFDEFNVPMHEFYAWELFTQSYYIKYEVLAGINNFYQTAFKIL